MILIYRILSVLALPFLVLYLAWRITEGKETRSRIRERFGFASKKRKGKKIIWIHCVSVGETNSALVLLDGLLQEHKTANIVFTTTTITSAKILIRYINRNTIYKRRVVHQFLPLDSYFCVKQFLNYWRPFLVLFFESEIWPNFVHEIKKTKAKLVLINGRMSQKSANRWLFAKKLGIKIFDKFDILFAQSSQDQSNLSKLTNKKILFCGNLKSQIRDLEFNEKQLDLLKKQIGKRPIWLASSTHAGEEEIIFNIHKKLKKDFPQILTILAPRHPQRAFEIISQARNIKIARRSTKQKIDRHTDVYLADTLGELGLFYRLCKVTFIGGSLLDNIGGHTPFEALKLGCLVISGKFVANNKEAYDELAQTNSCVLINNESELLKTLKEGFVNKEKFKVIRQNAKKQVNLQKNITTKILKELK